MPAADIRSVIETSRSLRRFELNIDFLMIAAAIGAAILGQWVEGPFCCFSSH
jgi:Zn2+/Cd2+-exporting ATPase